MSMGSAEVCYKINGKTKRSRVPFPTQANFQKYKTS